MLPNVVHSLPVEKAAFFVEDILKETLDAFDEEDDDPPCSVHDEESEGDPDQWRDDEFDFVSLS